MRVVMTGATGFVGSRVANKLAANGHYVVAAVRDIAAAGRTNAFSFIGESVVAPLEDAAALAELARNCDAVVHLGFQHGPDLAAAVAQDRKVIAAFVEALAGSGKPLVASSATGIIGDTGGDVVDEEHPSPAGYPPAERRRPEGDIVAAADRHVRASMIRVANLVHSEQGGGPIARLLNLARNKRESCYIGTGTNHLPCVHLNDLADLYVRALEHAPAGRIYNGNGGDVAMVDFAAAIGKAAGVPVRSIDKTEALSHFGAFAGLIFGLDIRPSNARARSELGWQPYAETPSIVEDVGSLTERVWLSSESGLRH